MLIESLFCIWKIKLIFFIKITLLSVFSYINVILTYGNELQKIRIDAFCLLCGFFQTFLLISLTYNRMRISHFVLSPVHPFSLIILKSKYNLLIYLKHNIRQLFRVCLKVRCLTVCQVILTQQMEREDNYICITLYI